MIGTQVASPRLFYDFCLDDHVPSDHLLRRIDQFLDLERWRGVEAFLQQDWPSLYRSRTDDADADHRIQHGHPV